MTMSLSVGEVLRSPHSYQRGRFSLAVIGLLVAGPGDCRIHDDPFALDDLGRAIQGDRWRPDPGRPAPSEGASIRIDDPTFLPRLLAEVPPIEDDEFSYFDVAMVNGSTRLDPGEVVLHEVWGVTLVRGGRLLSALKG